MDGKSGELAEKVDVQEEVNPNQKDWDNADRYNHHKVDSCRDKVNFNETYERNDRLFSTRMTQYTRLRKLVSHITLEVHVMSE